MRQSFFRIVSFVRNLLGQEEPGSQSIDTMTYSEIKEIDGIITAFQRLIGNLRPENKLLGEAASSQGRTARYALLSQAIIESISSGILVIEKDRRIGLLNTAARTILGLDEEGSIGKCLADIFGDYEDLDRLLSVAFLTGRGQKRKEIALTTKHGERLILGATLSPINLSRGECEAVIMVFALLGHAGKGNPPKPRTKNFKKRS